MATELLIEAGLTAQVCPDLPSLVEQLGAGAGLALIVEEELASADLKRLADWVSGQASWSDFPFIVLSLRSSGPERNPAVSRLEATLANVLFVERPFHPTSLISLVQSALRGRRRQYEARARIEDLREGQEQLRFAQEAGRIGTFELFPETGTLRISPAFCRLWGLPQSETVLLSDLYDLLDPEDRALLRTNLPDPPRDALAYTEYRVHRPDTGEWRWIARQGEQVTDKQTGSRRYFGVVYDITERRRIEDQLRESRDRLDSESQALEILNRTATMVAVKLDLDEVVQAVVDGGVELTGAAFGAFFYNIIDAEGESYMLYALAGADRAHFDQFGMPRATAVFGPTFRGEGIVRSADITLDPRYGHNSPHHGMPKGHLPVRSYLAAPVASRSGEVVGGLFFGHPEAGRFDERAERLMEGLAAHAATAIDNARLFQRVQSANESLEARVQERTRELDRLWRNSQDMLVVVGADGVFHSVNPAWRRILGLDPDEVVGRPFSDFVHPDDVAATAVAVQRATTAVLTQFENRFRHCDGGYRWFSWTAAPDENGLVYGNGRHITAEREAKDALAATEDALRQAQKMEAVGQLTGGIAHDFNNLLQGITGSLDLMQRRIAQGRASDLAPLLSGAAASANRAAALTHRLLAFSRRQPLDPRAVDANPLIGSMQDLLRRTLGEGVNFAFTPRDGLWSTLCDPNQLESAILNLCINARDAMPDGGRLTIETCNTRLDSNFPAGVRAVRPGEYVCICVSDTGVGMSAETVARAFDPFFTTKPLGQGTGLGLSMIYGFARQSEGYAKIYSEPGRGTTVKLYLPRHLGEASVEEVAEPGQAPAAAAGETVLVIEDEPVVRALIVEVLNDLGYRTLQAQEGGDGLEILRSSQRIDLLVTDIGLPGLNGRQVADAARELRPDLKVLFMTGYAENAALSGGFLEPGMAMITKPFPMDSLASRVRDIMEGRDETEA